VPTNTMPHTRLLLDAAVQGRAAAMRSKLTHNFDRAPTGEHSSSITITTTLGPRPLQPCYYAGRPGSDRICPAMWRLDMARPCPLHQATNAGSLLSLGTFSTKDAPTPLMAAPLYGLKGASLYDSSVHGMTHTSCVAHVSRQRSGWLETAACC